MNEKDAAYQRPPQGQAQGEWYKLEICLHEGELVGHGGNPVATLWLHHILMQNRAYLSELADYGRTVKRLNLLVELHQEVIGQCLKNTDACPIRGAGEFQELQSRLEELRRR